MLTLTTKMLLIMIIVFVIYLAYIGASSTVIREGLYAQKGNYYIMNPNKVCPEGGEIMNKGECAMVMGSFGKSVIQWFYQGSTPGGMPTGCSMTAGPIGFLPDSYVGGYFNSATGRPNAEIMPICKRVPPKCSTFSCPTSTTPKDANTECAGSTCTQNECCVPKTTCNASFQAGRSCPSSMTKKGGSITCSGVPQPGSCQTSECCDPKATCSGYHCDALHTPKPPSTLCAGATCTSPECCTPNPTCSYFPCGAGYTIKSESSGITCLETPCSKDECCNINPLCAGFSCPTGESLKSNANTYTCSGPTCTEKECCGINPTCAGHMCKSTFYTIKTLLSNNSKIRCSSSKCTDDECCESRSSNRLSLIKTWPLS